MEIVKNEPKVLLSTLEDGIDIVITELTIIEFRKSRFSTYTSFCKYIETNLKGKQIAIVQPYISSIHKDADAFFGFGDELYGHIFSFFLDNRSTKHYELVYLMTNVYGGFIKKRQ